MPKLSSLAIFVTFLSGFPIGAEAHVGARLLSWCAQSLQKMNLSFDENKHPDSDEVGLVEKLMSLGYSENVSKKILVTSPNFASQVAFGLSIGVRWPYEAITLYRGLWLNSIEELNCSHIGSNFANEIHFTKDALSTRILAHGSDQNRNFFVVLEVQAPRFLVQSQFLANLVGLSNFFISTADVSDLTPFISRTAIHTKEEVFKNEFQLRWQD